MVKVVTDSSCDIPPQLAHELSINILPLYIHFGGKTYRDGIDINADMFYKELAHSQEAPKTSVPPPGDFIKVYKDLALETDQIISVHLSSGYSGTYNTARLAKSYVENNCRVEVIDSNSVSVGLSLVVIAAARAAREGKNLNQIIELVQRMIPRIRMFGKIDDFPYLFRGKRFRLSEKLIILGKISTVLHINLLAEVYDGGKIRSPSFVIGSRMALNRLKRWASEFQGLKEMAIAYSTPSKEVEMLVERLEPLFPRERMLISRLGCVGSTYTGNGTLIMALLPH
jgi:DegV family protein with EDD domain